MLTQYVISVNTTILCRSPTKLLSFNKYKRWKVFPTEKNIQNLLHVKAWERQTLVTVLTST